MNTHKRRSAFLLPVLSLALLTTACDNRQERAQEAYSRYQAALVSGDLPSARQALITLVAADDSNPDYWIELGKVSMQMSEFGAAFDAYERAHELDRANVEVLAIMTQLALRSGNLAAAEDIARQLELVAPTNPAVSLTKGYLALRRTDLAEAEKQAAIYSELAPYESSGKILQSRILLAREQPDAAVALLSEQIRKQPSDALSLRAIANLYELREQWPEAAAALRNYLAWQPTDRRARAKMIECELRANQIATAEEVTLAGLAKDDIDALVAPWISLGKQDVIADRALAFARTADVGRRIAVSRFLLTTKRSQAALDLIAGEASLPVTPANAIANAVYGAALAQSGRTKEGLARLDEVLKIDGTIREALGARAQLRSRAGAHQKAIEDAQRLVAADRTAAQARLLLARIYIAAGDSESARRTLWDAFHEIEGDRGIYDALNQFVTRSEGPQAAARLAKEFYDQRNARIIRSFA